ncbi:hypothetical protein E1301_Tti014414 [Triplophysa tibetana]|uniref:Ciliary neurotrophic factor n=1 Tax=Triplophysa tibetana TaxID=1572043 RepID=A0A5A9P5C8_9TELE|nr:hypothetical protein E1301_Tti014414 [Triplophysa tibetana]
MDVAEMIDTERVRSLSSSDYKRLHFLRRRRRKQTDPKASNLDSTDFICDMQMVNVPVSTISGQSISERIFSVYTRLKEFLPHLKTVMEQQKDFDPPTNPVSDGLKHMIAHVDRISLIVNCLLQVLKPNIPILEPAERPTGIPPAQNAFQQKAYGCIVLSRLQELLSPAFQELKSLRGRRCRRRTELPSLN